MMNTMPFLRNMAVLIVLGTAGCASVPMFSETPILFPPAPSEPRIRYETSIRGAMDFRRVTFIDRLLGLTVTREIEKPFDVYARGDKVYISDTARRFVHVIDFTKKTASAVGDVGSGKLRLPLGVRGTPDGTLYVADGVLKTVRVYDGEGRHLRDIGKPEDFQNPAGIAVNSRKGRLYIADTKAHAVKVYSTKGEFLFQFGSGGDDDGRFQFPSFIEVDIRNDNVYVADTNNFRVQVFDADGTFIRKFGELGDLPGLFQRPKGVGIASDGNVFVVEAVFNNFQIFNDQGQVLTWVGWGGRAGGGAFGSPAGIYIDEQDRVYVVDAMNKRVQVFQYFSDAWKQKNPDLFKQYTGKQ
jgi:DNA-binding beta-propeller fold protein YncE